MQCFPLDSLSPVEIHVEEVNQQMDHLAFLSVQDITLESVCDLESLCLENILGTLPQTFHSAIIESMHCILDGIMEQL